MSIVWISRALGWGYFIAWSASFYPQIYKNWKRKSVVGLSHHFVILNIMGYICYVIFTTTMYDSTLIKLEYISTNGGHKTKVQINDIAFAIHALFASLLMEFQIIYYGYYNTTIENPVSRIKRNHIIIYIILALCISINVLLGIFVKVYLWLWCMYALSAVKLFITLIKYFPQINLNYKRKSTVGWSIGEVFLDFSGAFLSLLQIMVDCIHNPAGIAENWTKTGLGTISIIYNIIFMLQHFVLYKDRHNYAQLDTADEIW